MKRTLPMLVAVLVAACGDSACPQVEALPNGESILAIGDSILGLHREACAGIPGQLAMVVGNRVENEAVPGLAVSSEGGGDDIRRRLGPVDGGWVLFSGGGNDLLLECGCNANVDEAACRRVIDALVSEDGTRGEVPELLDRAREAGARVIVVGYYPLPEDAAGNFDACAPYATELNRRYRAHAEASEGVRFYDPIDEMQFASFPERFHWDRIHPSQEGALVMAERIAALIRSGGE